MQIIGSKRMGGASAGARCGLHHSWAYDWVAAICDAGGALSELEAVAVGAERAVGHAREFAAKPPG